MQKVPQEPQTVFMSILSYSKTGSNNVQLLICNILIVPKRVEKRDCASTTHVQTRNAAK